MSNQGFTLPSVDLGAGSAPRTPGSSGNTWHSGRPKADAGGRQAKTGQGAVKAESSIAGGSPNKTLSAGIDDSAGSQSRFDTFASMGPVDTTGLTHAELVHYFWHFFKQQVGTLNDALVEVRHDIASLQDVSKQETTKDSCLTADIDERLAKVHDAIFSSDKSWREEVARLSCDIEANRATSLQDLDSGLSKLGGELRTESFQLKAELAASDSKRTLHEQQIEGLRERVMMCDGGLETLRGDLTGTSRELRTNIVELREVLSKSLTDLSIRLQTEMMQTSNKSFVHIEDQVAHLQAGFEADDQCLRADMEQGFKEMQTAIRDNHQMLVGSTSVLDSKLRMMIAEECGKNRTELSELGRSFQGSISALKHSSDESLAYVPSFIGDVSDRHQRDYSSLCERLYKLEDVVKDGGCEAATVRHHVDEIRNVPLIRGALSQGA